MRLYFIFFFFIPFFLGAQVTKFMGRFDVTSVAGINDSTWNLSGTFVDLTGSFVASDASIHDKIIQRGYDSIGRVVFDRYVITYVLPSVDVFTLNVNVQSDFIGGIQNNVGMPLTGSFPIASPTADTSKLTYRTLLFHNQIDPDYSSAIENMNLSEISFSSDGIETDPVSFHKADSNTNANPITLKYFNANNAAFPGFGTSHSTSAYGDHAHSGVYDPAGTASGLMTTHNSSYTHANIANGQTAFGWGNHASAGYVTGTPWTTANTSGTSGGLSGQYIDWAATTGGTSIKGKPTISGSNTGDNAVNSLYSGLVTFPGFGTSHVTSAYGDHAHSGVYDPAGTASGLMTTHNSSYTHANIANGQTAFGWGNHASVGYLNQVYGNDVNKSIGSWNNHIDFTDGQISYNASTHYYVGKIGIGANPDSTLTVFGSLRATNILASGKITASGGNSTNWNSAYSWGNHASAGYVTGTPWTSMGYITSGITGSGTSGYIPVFTGSGSIGNSGFSTTTGKIQYGGIDVFDATSGFNFGPIGEDTDVRLGSWGNGILSIDGEINYNSTLHLFSGSVGIGCAPAYPLNIEGNSSATAPILQITDTYTAGATRGGTVRLGSNDGTVMANGERLGTLAYTGYNGTGIVGSARLKAYATETWSSTARGTKFVFSITPNTTTTETDAVIIDQNGFIGIGTTTPQQRMHVAGNIKVDNDIQLNNAPNNDSTSGTILNMNIATGGVTSKTAVCIYSAGTITTADKGQTARPAIGIALTGTNTAGTTCRVLISGFMRNDTWNWTPGRVIYLGASGALTQTVPTISGDMVQIIGIATGTDHMIVNPQLVTVIIQ